MSAVPEDWLPRAPHPHLEPRGVFPTGVMAIGWGVATAVCAGTAWVLAFYLVEPRWEALRALVKPAVTEFGFRAVGLGALTGLTAGALAGLRFVRRDWGDAVAALGIGFALMGASGAALCLIAVTSSAVPTEPLTSTTLVWSLAGFLAGVAVYVWTCRIEVARQQADEERSSGAVGGTTSGRVHSAPVAVLLVLLLVVSVLALAGAAYFVSVGTVFALLLIGLLGMLTTCVLWQHDRQLRELERRIQRRPNASPGSQPTTGPDLVQPADPR